MKKRLGFDLILLGDPTAGKDTQADILIKKYLLKPVESGKHWRNLAKKKNSQGRLLRRTMAMGHPAPVSLMRKFLAETFKNAPKNRDLIFVGTPRLKPEAQMTKRILEGKKRDFFVLYLRIPPAEIYKRTNRRGRRLPESTERGIKNRINYHKNQVSKTVKYFKSFGKLKFIDSTQSIPKVAARIERVLLDYKQSQGN